MTSNFRKLTVITAIFTAILLMGALPARAMGLTAAQGIFAPVAQEAASEAVRTGPVSDLDLSSAVPRANYYENPKIYSGERISLDFQNADMHNIIRIIGEVSGKNIVVSDAVKGKVTLKLKDVPWDQALDIVLASRNLGVEESGNVLTIYDLPTLNNIQSGRQRLAAERAAAAALVPLGKKVFTPKYSPISVVAAELNKIKSNRGKIVAIGNDIYVEDDPNSLATMTQIFMRIDRVARQILIEARIIEATSTFIQKLGVNWNGKYDGGSTNVGGSHTPGEAWGNADFNKTATLGFGFLNKANSLLLNATISASETSSDARTISAPRIMAANDQTVSIKQGKQIPYQSGYTANNAGNIQFKDVVMELKVKPHIEENGQIVTLDIKLTNDTPDYAGGTENEPAVNTREAETKLMVKDGETVVIGGIIVDNQTTATDRVPGFHRIPLLGWLFKTNEINNDKSEMLIFITANIIPLNI